MSFIEDVSNICGIPYDDIFSNLVVNMVSNKCVTVTNFISILSYDNTKVLFKLKDNVLIVSGEALYIKDIESSSVVVSGKIDSIGFSR